MKLPVLSLWGGITLGLATAYGPAMAQSANPSFACGRARTAVELTICASPELSNLDRQQARAFEAATGQRGAERAQGAIRTSQRAWLAEREGCGRDASCIARLTRQHIEELSAPGAPKQSSPTPAGRSATAPEPFREPLLDRATVLRLNLAVRPDILANDLAAVLRAGEILRAPSPECRDLKHFLEDETQVPEAIALARQVTNRAAEAAKAAGHAVRVRFIERAALLAYDPQHHVFPLARDRDHFIRPVRSGVFLPAGTDYHPFYELDPNQCLTGVTGRAAARLPVSAPSAMENIGISGGERIDGLHLPPDAARRLIATSANGAGLFVDIEYVADLDAKPSGLFGTIVAARAIWPPDGTVLQVFGVRAGGDTARSSEAMPSDHQILRLNAIRFSPELISDGLLARTLPHVIAREQYEYRRATERFSKPTQPFFAMDEIAGRDPSFAALDLAPKFRAHIIGVATRTGSRVWSSRAVAYSVPPVYDPASGQLRLDPGIGPSLLSEVSPGGIFVPEIERRPDPKVVPRLSDCALYAPAVYGGSGMAADYKLSMVINEINVPAVCLDRLLPLPTIPLARAEAERLAKVVNNSRPLEARVYYTITGNVTMPAPSDRVQVLLAHLDGVSIVEPSGAELARFPADRFPLAADTFAARAEAKKAADEKAAAARAATAQAQAAAAAEQKRLASLEVERTARERAEAAQREANAREQAIIEAQRRPAGAFGPDVAGVRIGMTFAEADAAARAALHPVAVIDPDPRAWGAVPRVFGQHVFVGEDGRDLLAIYTLPQAGNRIVGLSRRIALPVPALSKADALQLLTNHYGTPTSGSGLEGSVVSWIPSGRADPTCPSSVSTVMQGQGFRYSEGSLAAMRSRGGADSNLDANNIASKVHAILRADEGSDTSRIQEARACPTTLWAMIDLNPVDPYILLAVHDGGWVASLLQREAQESRTGSMDAVRSMLDGKAPQQARRDMETPLVGGGVDASSPGRLVARTVPGITVMPPSPQGAQPNDDRFATAELALKQQALVSIWPGFADLRRLRSRDYDAALASVPIRDSVTDTNTGTAVIATAMAQSVKVNLQDLMKLDDKDAVDLIRSQVSVYAGVESQMGAEFCGRSLQNDLGPFASQAYLLEHAAQITSIVKSNLDQVLKVIRAQEAHKAGTLRTVPTSLDLAPFAPDLVALQTYRATRQYGRICGAISAFLTKVLTDDSAGAPKARIMALIAIQ